MQLDAFLRSAGRHAPYASIEVLTDSTFWGPSYETVFREQPSTTFWNEHPSQNFEYLTRSFLARHDRVVFHTDDDVFFQAWDGNVGGITWEGIHRPPSSFTFRLGQNTTYCHPTGLAQTPPEPNDYVTNWLWKDEHGDFGYPLTLNGTVYRSADLLPLLDFPFANPTELEAGLAARAGKFGPQWMTAPLHSCCVSLPHNRVSASSGCPAGSNPEWQPEALREAFLDGWRIDLEAMDFSAVVGAHQEIPLKFKRLHTRP